MTVALPNTQAAGIIPRRLFYYNAGFLRHPHLRRILALAGHDLRLGLPGPEDGVVVWGRSPYARRGQAIAARYDVPLIRIEDAFLRSIRPGRLGDLPLGLLIDGLGVHFDSATPSTLEMILAKHPLDDSNLLTRARDGIARIRTLDLSKYNLHLSDAPLPAPGYVLVVDQIAGDASIRHSGANSTRFAEMLATAQSEHPTARIVIKTHPETQLGLRRGHFTAADQTDRIQLLTTAVSPWALLEGAIAVYTVSSQLGFEAILAGHRPHVFGQPFYAGWGLTSDVFPIDRRRRSLTKTQLFAAAMILAPTWVDPCRNRLCSFEEAVDQLEAEARAHREDRFGHVALGMRVWKRGRLQAVFGREKSLIFQDNPAKAIAKARATGRGLLVWAGKEPADLPKTLTIHRVEDGFLRSRGLGAELVPPLSLVSDDRGIYYDATRASRLEQLIQTPLPPNAARRTEKLITDLIAVRLSKYNLSGSLPDLPEGMRVLVPGQVENDASIRLGAGDIRTNLALLQAARSAHPNATIIYKPHPDVEAGLRPGAIPDVILRGLADVIAHHADPIQLIEACDEVVTMTSLLGFEALLRGKRVTCLGAPFYAGWGLTQDLGPIPARRKQAKDGHPLPRPSLLALAHAALIAYPRYYDPVSRKPCPPEVVIHRLATGTDTPTGLGLRLLAKLQGRFATYSRFWR
ncbi:capsular polysaccharide biosynthesis protein [Cypionkella sp.]|uniref:capsular polysaccharide biosynthesis protein n=1 Tax=Cypionkella sp. TaxID=2811411 RepID=UPI00271BFF96|nr:capsular polysaccharide biosynthesis protein [Cypionkella sp.]MDO8984176.1 capsular polysaccharide biosynthesis protein [Cypionkella sp.]MDP2047850.1 capsular polysaccharide biosynthesis protein [Cypionkella sp.]